MYASNLRDIYLQSLQYNFHLYTTCKSDYKIQHKLFSPPKRLELMPSNKIETDSDTNGCICIFITNGN